jgi:L-lactate dehydrogenase complex protein LldE
VEVALFITCLNDTLFPGTGRATVTLLERVGCTVAFPEEQTCCGQMHANAGYGRDAVALVRRFVEIFAPYEVIVTPSGSCAAMVRTHYAELARETGDPELERAAAAVAARVHELTEFLVSVLGVEDVGAVFPHRVTYHPACHGLRALGNADAALRLLRRVQGITLVDLPDAATCCGFGGTFSLKNPETSAAMLTDKMRAVLQTGAEVVCAVDSSCLMHVGGGLSRGRAGVTTLHVAEILAS